jgi:hypothetical protein
MPPKQPLLLEQERAAWQIWQLLYMAQMGHFTVALLRLGRLA